MVPLTDTNGTKYGLTEKNEIVGNDIEPAKKGRISGWNINNNKNYKTHNTIR